MFYWFILSIRNEQGISHFPNVLHSMSPNLDISCNGKIQSRTMRLELYIRYILSEENTSKNNSYLRHTRT